MKNQIFAKSIYVNTARDIEFVQLNAFIKNDIKDDDCKEYALIASVAMHHSEIQDNINIQTGDLDRIIAQDDEDFIKELNLILCGYGKDVDIKEPFHIITKKDFLTGMQKNYQPMNSTMKILLDDVFLMGVYQPVDLM